MTEACGVILHAAVARRARAYERSAVGREACTVAQRYAGNGAPGEVSVTMDFAHCNYRPTVEQISHDAANTLGDESN